MEYPINKGVAQPLVLAGIKGKYILYLVIGIVAAFISYFVFQLFNQVLALVSAGLVALGAYLYSSYMSNKHGVDGVTFVIAGRHIPDRIRAERARDLVRVG